MSEIEVSTDDMGLASDGVIPESTYESALMQIKNSYDAFKVVAKESSKRNILRALDLTFVGGEVPQNKREEILIMSHMMQKIVEGIIVCKEYELQNQPVDENEGDKDEWYKRMEIGRNYDC